MRATKDNFFEKQFEKFVNNFKMSEKTYEVLHEFGKRVQRCYGCFIPYHLKTMYLGDDVTFFCENCKDNSMFHFDEFSKMLEIGKLREAEEDEHRH